MWIIVRVLIGIAILFLLEFYFTKKLTGIFRTLLPQLSDKKKKTFLYLFLVLLNLYPVILIFNGVYAAITKQSVAFPENFFADYFLLYPFWILILVIVQVSVLFVFLDLLKLVLYPVYKKHKEKLKKSEARLFLVLTLFFLIYVPARIIYDYNTVNVNQITHTINDLPNSLNNFKIVFISDVQADRYTDGNRLKKFIDKVNFANPDLVLIAGDVITSTPNYIETAAKYIGKIKSKYGVYSCVGDHDNWAYRRDYARSLREVEKALDDYKVEMIDNGIRYVNVDSVKIGITFITNTYVSDVPESTLKNLSVSDNAQFKIFLTHQPRSFLIESALNNNYNLFLAGHTHGGQITFLFPFIQLTPTLIENTFIKGERYHGNMLAVVTRGLGMSLAPIRYNSTPEIVIINLKK
jgi:predicted MPP superfamily phosphohydrolase